MRTAEVRVLRERLAISEQYLEDTAVTRNTLKKAHARIKDLKEQLTMKGGRDDEHEHEGAPVADQELLQATGTGGDIRQQEGGERQRRCQ